MSGVVWRGEVTAEDNKEESKLCRPVWATTVGAAVCEQEGVESNGRDDEEQDSVSRVLVWLFPS